MQALLDQITIITNAENVFEATTKSKHSKVRLPVIENLFLCIYIWIICNADVNKLGVQNRLTKFKEEKHLRINLKNIGHMKKHISKTDS